MKKVKIITDKLDAGLGATIMRGLHCLYYKPSEDLYYFDFYNKWYSDNNVWNTFFIQPFKAEIGTDFVEVNTINNIFCLGNFFLSYGKSQDKYQFNNTTLIKTLQKLFHKYVNIHPYILEKAVKMYNSDFTDHKVLGVHRRATAHFYNGHTAGQRHLFEIDFYKKVIDDQLRNNNFTKIFLATDEQQAYDDLVNYYGKSMMIKYPTELVSPANNHQGLDLLHINDEHTKRVHLGIEMLSDAFLLSKCDYCLNMRSNVSLTSIMMRDNHNYKFIDDHIDYGCLG
jgi:hypothetical protein